MSNQKAIDQHMKEKICANSDSLFSHIVNEVQEQFKKEKSFRDYHTYFKTWLKNLEPGCEINSKHYNFALQTFYSMLNENCPAFNKLPPKMQFLMFLATDAPVPKAFADRLANVYHFSVSYLDKELPKIDYFSTHFCTCTTHPVTRCIITRGKLMKCRWEKAFDKKVKTEAALERVQVAPRNAQLAQGQDDRPMIVPRNLEIHIHVHFSPR